jgi:hypothetical protein
MVVFESETETKWNRVTNPKVAEDPTNCVIKRVS